MCQYFGICGSCNLSHLSYEAQIEYKKGILKELFNIQPEIFFGEQFNYRVRSEFNIIKKDGFYAMKSVENKTIPIDSCKIVSQKIETTMTKLKEIIPKSKLYNGLFFMEFLSSNQDEIVVMLAYKKEISDELINEAIEISKQTNIPLIVRSKGKKIVTKDECVTDMLKIETKEILLKKCEGSFSQPNTQINQKMITWAYNASKEFEKDLLELYCGNGNFTIALSENFNKILATEIDKRQIKIAQENSAKNEIKNISFVRLSSSETANAIDKKREFKRLKDIRLDEYEFSTIFVDPPRSGLDTDSLKIASKFKHIIYISCNPIALKRDMQTLKESHKMVKLAFFDQFPNTKHIECGAILKKKDGIL